MKSSPSKMQKLMAIVVVIVTLLLLLFVFSATQSALDVWERLQKLPEPLFYLYSALILVGLFFSFAIIFRLLRPSSTTTEFNNKEVTQESILKELNNADDVGMETSKLRREIEHLQERKATGKIYVALFGTISMGKSSIIKALLPDAKLDISVRGGSTQTIKEYTWTSRSGDQLVLTDLPGKDEAGGSLDAIANEEAIRAQLVIYVTDSDLSRSQFDDIKQLQSYGKPMIIALNKSDRLNGEEKQLIKSRFTDHFSGDDRHQEKAQSMKQIFVQSGGKEEVFKIYPDGREEKVIRERKVDVLALAEAMQDEIDQQSDVLETLRDASVFVLVKQKLDIAKDEFRLDKAEAIISSSTRKAIFGALAAISPGSDLVIQGVLGAQMVKGLCALYQVPVRQLDIDKLLDFSGGQMKKSAPIILAVAGNGMKAFPGIGTLTGGLTHAVAYGMIFDALGHAINKTLQQRGKLQPAPVAITFKEILNQNLEERAKLFAKLVFDSQKK